MTENKLVTLLYMQCSFPLAPAIAMSDCCRKHATSAVRDQSGNYLYRCPSHRGIIEPGRTGPISFSVPVPREEETTKGTQQ